MSILLLTQSLLYICCLCTSSDSSSTIQSLTENTFRYMESTTSLDEETSFLTSETDLTTETMQQHPFSTNQGADGDLITVLPQTTEQIVEITSHVKRDQNSKPDLTTWSQSESSKATSTMQDLLTNTININNIDLDSVTSATTELVGTSSEETNAVSSSKYPDALATTEIIPNTVGLNNESLVLSSTQNYTDTNDTQVDKSNINGDTLRLYFCFVVVRSFKYCSTLSHERFF